MFAISLGDDGAELTPLQPWQAEEFFAHIDGSRAFIGAHIGLPDAVCDLAAARAFLRAYAQKSVDDAGYLYGIRFEGRLVGGLMFRTFNTTNETAEVGCWVEESAAGKGLVTRACRTIIDWAVEQRGMHRIEWVAPSGNTPSLAVARRLGMSREGVLREQYPYRGKRADMEVWSVLAHEWRAAKAAAAAEAGAEAGTAGAGATAS
ncbi:GNAT family N-acetyltransferase [Streptomyces sp. NPDC048718]|uniref:GNAT family N-acetyltransferase n=1 Tax=Streptomyces sp. NPDC048718 TaxID=3365587 RepID=UPI00371D5E02